MLLKEIEIEVYGAEQICASCVNLPSSKDTCEWLEAALKRKFPEQSFKISYIDMYNPPEKLKQKTFAAKMIEEDLFYPLVLIEDEIIAEGNVRLKKVVETLERYGYKGQL
ncbi:YuzD family protein [Peribacillus muralis]|uniref:YuzD family protein n=1 Tax=Peribacillus muralis TaxID=264697 RepID=UPI001F4E8A1E|nr:YuzD family protein [Peribacillus muralis]MCK1994295.1 YuzD family protein [Peribacillus muralis]MCK2014920.1 YuzD family protein [Peribacillus muralis]